MGPCPRWGVRIWNFQSFKLCHPPQGMRPGDFPWSCLTVKEGWQQGVVGTASHVFTYSFYDIYVCLLHLVLGASKFWRIPSWVSVLCFPFRKIRKRNRRQRRRRTVEGQKQKPIPCSKAAGCWKIRKRLVGCLRPGWRTCWNQTIDSKLADGFCVGGCVKCFPFLMFECAACPLTFLVRQTLE